MVAYACGPEATGEHWLGWGWAREAARLGSLDLITTPKYQESILAQAEPLGITCHFLSPSGRAGWIRKSRWQREVFAWARRLHAARPYDLVHQTTFHTFRIPFRCAGLGIPSVWGPIAGGESVPPGFYGVLGQSRHSEWLRSWINRLCLYQPAVRRSLRQATRVFVSNRTSLSFLPPRFHSKCRVVPPNALSHSPLPVSAARPSRNPTDPLRLLYVGNCVATRAIPLVLQALRSAGPQVHLKVVGQGPALGEWREQAIRAKQEAQVEFLGAQPKERLTAFYREADLFVFPALRDSGGSALLEAMEQGLPVLCFPWGGPAEMVNEETGFLVRTDRPEQTIRDMVTILNRLQQDPELGARRAQAAALSVRDRFSWRHKGALLQKTYAEILSS